MKAAGLLCLVLLPLATAWGQQAAAPADAQPRKLTLREALDLAARQNLDLAAARLRQAVAQAGVRIARQYPNPTVAFSASRDLPHESLVFEQPLEIGGRRRHRVEFAQQQVSLTSIEIDTVARQVRRRVRQAFFTAALARAVTRQRGQALELTERLQSIAKARFDAGDIPQLEVYQADLEVARVDADYKVAQQRERIAFSQLNALLNEPPQTRWEPASYIEDLPPRISLDELVRRAQEANPDYQHVLQEQKVEQSRRALLRAERVPNLNVDFGSDFNAPPDFRVGPRGGFSMTLPLFSRNQGEIAQSSATLRMLESEIAATRRSVAGKIEAAYFDLEARQAQVELYRNSLRPATQRLENLLEESYRAGRANLLAVLDAQRNVQQVERDYLDSLFALQTAFAELEETIGSPLD